MKPGQSHQPPAVVKKSSPNGKLTIYLGKRDFISYKDYVENVDGVVLIDPIYLERIKKHRVLITLNCIQNFGKEDKFSDTCSKFENQLFSITNQIYPNNESDESQFNQLIKSENCITESEQPLTTTQLQNHILQKLAGKSKYAFPFYFKLPDNSANSVSILSANKSIGVSYEIKVWILENMINPDKIANANLNSKLEGILPSTYELDSKEENVSTAYSFGSIHPIAPQQTEDSINDDNSYLKQKMTVDASCMHIGTKNTPKNEKIIDKQMKKKNSGMFSGNPLNREVNIVIRKFHHYLNSSPLPPPESFVKESFLVGKDVTLKVSLDKSVYRHNEKIYVNIEIDNQSGKDVKKVKFVGNFING